MAQWEYRKIPLNQLPRKADDIDLLCDAGEVGWELIAILENNVAYLKREVEEPVSETAAAQRDPVVWREEKSATASTEKAYEVKPKYRDPNTNETWSGRGRMATWLKRKQDAGEDIEKYLV